MKGKIFALIFALPFFGIGVWMAYSISGNLIDAAKTKQWVPVEASLQRAGYERHSGDDADTYEAYAQYTYEFAGQTYAGSRVSISGGADNIGDYQTDLGDRLSRTMGRNETVTVFVNPDDPSAAIIDRSIRWGLMGFKSIFLFVFGGIGLGLIVLVLRAPKKRDVTLPEFQHEPWKANDNWQSEWVRSTSKGSMVFSWGFAAIWNLISAPLPFLVYNELTEKGNLLALIGLLFPLIGMGLLSWAIRRTLEWRRFGAAPIELDPFPGSIGGHVGGMIDVNIPFDPNVHVSVTLTNLHSYMSGSGKDRSRRESAKWQDTQVAHVSAGPKGSRLIFRFDVPADLPESNATQGNDSYHLWRLNVSADIPGVDFDRDYEIPVYATSKESRRLSEFSVQRAKSEQKKIDVQLVEKIANMSHGPSGKFMIFPMGRNLAGGIGGVLFGAIFTGAGLFLTFFADHWFMGAIFGAVGLVIFLSGFYFMFNSLEVREQGSNIQTIRRILGIPVKRREMRRSDFSNFDKHTSLTTQSGSKHVVHYSISARDRNGLKMVVGEGFRGAGQAAVAAEFIGRQFGLRAQSETEERVRSVDADDFLAAD